MIHHECYTNFESSLTRSIRREDRSVKKEDETFLTFPKHLCHTYPVERCIRLVTEACVAVGENQRDVHIRVKLKSWSIINQFPKKADYNLN
jgi:hypothetical protein